MKCNINGFLFFIIFLIYIELGVNVKELPTDSSFSVFALNDNTIVNAAFPISNFQDEQNLEISTESYKISQHKLDICPPKPSELERDPRTFETVEPGEESVPPIRIKVPTVANTGSTLIIEGSGFIPEEEIRVELSIDWISSSSEVTDKNFFHCKIIQANDIGSFSTTIQLPEMPFDTRGVGKYSIIGMESRQEETKGGSFLTSTLGFSFRQ